MSLKKYSSNSKMSCSADEIAEKRRLALERLKSKKQIPSTSASAYSTASSSTNIYSSSSNLNTAGTGKIQENFYGTTNTNMNPTHKLPSNDSKILQQNPYKNARILSQPYNTNTKSGIPQKPTLAPVFTKHISCVCSMVSDERFNVVPSGFHAKLIDVFKTIPSRAYNPDTKIWTFLLSDYQLVQERVSSLNPDVVIGSLPKFVIKLLSQPATPLNYTCISALEPTLSDVLMNFQKEGVCFGIEKKGRCMIADEMGLGKTYQAIAIADFYKDDWPLLVVTTAGTRDVWASKIRSLLPYVPCQQIVCMTTLQDYFGDAKVLILSYSLMEKNCDKLMEKNFGFIVFDESHQLKNFKTKSTAVAIKLAKKARRIVLLTGTPALSRPSELFSQLQLIDSSFFNYREYTTRYCEGHQTNFGWNASGQSNLTELTIVLNRKFMIRRTKEQVRMELAEKSRETVMLDPNLIWKDDDTTENMKCYAEDFSKMKGRDREDILMKFYSETAKAKAKAVKAYIKGLVKEKQKFIVFAHHTVMMNAISECLQSLNVDFIRIDGTTRNDMRTAYIKHFQNHSSCLVAVLSLKACNTGITLTAAQLVVFAELDWNPSTLAQAESRAHRIGQEGSVVCRYLLAKGTADDAIWTMLKNKQNVLNKAGLFHEDLADGTHTFAPTASNNIEKYLTKSPSTTKENETPSTSVQNVTKKTIDNNSNNLIESPVTAPTTSNISDDLKCLLDEDDDDFAGLDF